MGVREEQPECGRNMTVELVETHSLAANTAEKPVSVEPIMVHIPSARGRHLACSHSNGDKERELSQVGGRWCLETYSFSSWL